MKASEFEVLKERAAKLGFRIEIDAEEVITIHFAPAAMALPDFERWLARREKAADFAAHSSSVQVKVVGGQMLLIV